jgi:putative membrane protein
LVACIDRSGHLGIEPPVVGWEAVQSLVTDMGVADPEDSRVNCMLEALRIARDLHDEDEEAVVAVISASGDSVSSDRAVARQTDDLVAEHDPDSAIVVVDSAEDERLVPIIESRVQVDAVDRVVVRQARDIESTYYLLKQFLADEELRKTVLVPIGVALLAFPALLFLADSPAVAVAAIAAVIGVFFLYKGMGVDSYLASLPGQIHDALYSGQVSLVTYVVAVGLALIGVFAGAIGVSATSDQPPLILGMRFAFDSIPWLTAAALAAATGRLLDEILRDEGLRGAYVNLPFGAVAVGLVVRGFSAYFLERANVFDPFAVEPTEVGPIAIEGFVLQPRTRLALFIFTGILVSLVGVRFSSYLSEPGVEEEVAEGSGPGTNRSG